MPRIKMDCAGCKFYKKYPFGEDIWHCQKNIGDGNVGRRLGILERELVFCPKYIEEVILPREEENRIANKGW